MTRFIALAGASLIALATTVARADDPPKLPTAAESDPVANKVMQGFPPPPDKTVRFYDGTSSKFPGTRWARCDASPCLVGSPCARSLAA